MHSAADIAVCRTPFPIRPVDPTAGHSVAAMIAAPPSNLETVRCALDIARKDPAASLAQRRQCFLAECWPQLGPTQQQHMSVHCRAVAAMAARMGRMQGYSETAVARIRLAGDLHDIGKCLIDESLLAKPARLSDAERARMSGHSPAGAWIAAALGADAATVALVRHHHTTYNQRHAMPDGQARREAQLLCVADAFVSMMTDRPYCRARSVDQALAELNRCSGTQFDPAAVDLAHRLYRRRSAAA